jgi:hypothetical protein
MAATDDPLRPEDPVAAYLQIDTRLRSPATGYRARLLAQSIASVSVPVRPAAAQRQGLNRGERRGWSSATGGHVSEHSWRASLLTATSS